MKLTNCPGGRIPSSKSGEGGLGRPTSGQYSLEIGKKDNLQASCERLKTRNHLGILFHVVFQIPAMLMRPPEMGCSTRPQSGAAARGRGLNLFMDQVQLAGVGLHLALVCFHLQVTTVCCAELAFVEIFSEVFLS